ncbi:MAG TPA: nucleoside triphosphate pyrophosphohydrolase [Candidatus Acidoferrales bacterium]|nr:nucleoside triphosphate pyrophosphohydrolase [Candidatus Acidoferrales bacterium]
MRPKRAGSRKSAKAARKHSASRAVTSKRAPRDRHVRVSPRDRVAGQWFAKLAALQAKLRGPNGCSWDAEQTHESLRKFLIEETYEVLDAMDTGDSAAFASELGDLLLQVIFHSVLAEERGRFAISDVIESVYSKMVRRHPHVFGSAVAKTSADVLRNWEQLKAEERASAKGNAGAKAVPAAAPAADSVLGGVPRSLPAVLEAYQLTRRASHVGFDWEDVRGIFEKLAEEGRELQEALGATSKRRPSARVEEEAGDLLFSAVNIARFLGVDPEIALKKANRKFKNRFQRMESAAAREGRLFADLPRPRKEELWNSLKSAEAPAARHAAGDAS